MKKLENLVSALPAQLQCTYSVGILYNPVFFKDVNGNYEKGTHIIVVQQDNDRYIVAKQIQMCDRHALTKADYDAIAMLLQTACELTETKPGFDTSIPGVSDFVFPWFFQDAEEAEYYASILQGSGLSGSGHNRKLTRIPLKDFHKEYCL